MYYICTFTQTPAGIDINNQPLITEDNKTVIHFQHATEKGYRSKKPLLVDFEHTINEYNEIQITDEVAAQLIEKYQGLTFKTFQTQYSRESSSQMTGLKAWASVMGDR